ncbi:MAG: 50S ribosomal protein L9, partial [Propionibacteriales bacterium]|nr:50S ribosomal protein L9 [Propionibacteriales bacterium]
AVTVTDIVDAVKNCGGPDIDKRRIFVDRPIKSLGAHQVTVKVHDEVSATVNLEVVPT